MADPLKTALDRIKHFQKSLEKADPAERGWLFASWKESLMENLAEVLATVNDSQSLASIDSLLGAVRRNHGLGDSDSPYPVTPDIHG